MVRKFTTQEVTNKINDFIDKYELIWFRLWK
jgi:translation initiation factor 2 beta subunit (eIF-2beta)/eIF-5